MSPNGATSERAAGRFAFGALPSGAASPWRTRAKLGARGPQRRFPGGLKRPRCVHLLLRAFRTLPLTRRDLVATGSADVRGGRGAEPAAGTRSRSPPASGPSEPSYPVYRRPLPRPCGSRTAAPAAAPRSARPSPRCFRGRSFRRCRGNRSTGQDPAQKAAGGPSEVTAHTSPPYPGASAAFWARSLEIWISKVNGTPRGSRDPRRLDALHRYGADLTAQPLASGSSGWSL